MGVVVAVCRAPWITECVPTVDDVLELDAGLGASVIEEPGLALDREVARAGVAVELGDLADLVDAELARCKRRGGVG